MLCNLNLFRNRLPIRLALTCPESAATPGKIKISESLFFGYYFRSLEPHAHIKFQKRSIKCRQFARPRTGKT
jgi:hypothetical protein